nr:GNAT family N-acetyltransferase [Marinicella sp. W31]MDC2878191.1 GNAT family N-acetyltransferase [Marinicella sp. W31]
MPRAHGGGPSRFLLAPARCPLDCLLRRRGRAYRQYSRHCDRYRSRSSFQRSGKGASLWCLASDPQARQRGIGEALVRRLAEHFLARGASHLDLSVLHDNVPAIRLYEKLGFKRVPFLP